MSDMNQVEPPHQSRAMETSHHRMRVSHTPATRDATVDQLVLERQRVIGSDGQPTDAITASYPNGALSTMDELVILDARRQALCNETPD